MSNRPTTTIYLDTRRKKIDGTYPIKLRVTYKRIRKYYSIGRISVTEDEFKRVMAIGAKGRYSNLREDLEDDKHRADQIIKELKPFSFASFEKEFLSGSPEDEDIFSLYIEYIKDLNSENRISTSESYQYSLKSLKDFTGRDKLSFEKIDPEFLRSYESYMLRKGKSVTTVGIYLRALRAIINIARIRGLMTIYPFGKSRDLYQIKNPPARKMALSSKELKKIFEYVPKEDTAEQYYLDLWKFLYLCGGMNVKDMCLLKWTNIVRDQIFYKREKTKNSNSNGKEVTIPIDDKIRCILNRWSSEEKSGDQFIFKILNKNMSSQKEYEQIRQTNKQINKYVRRVCKKLKININVSSYTARHSYASHLMRHGAPTAFISKQLGHANVKTTESYLENFEKRQLERWQKMITNFEL